MRYLIATIALTVSIAMFGYWAFAMYLMVSHFGLAETRNMLFGTWSQALLVPVWPALSLLIFATGISLLNTSRRRGD
jgi:hypothetical protein